MLRNIVRFGLVIALAITLFWLNPSSSQSASADQLNIVPLATSTTTQSATLQRSGGLVSFVRGITLRSGPGHRSGPVKLGVWNARGYGHGFKIEFTPHHGIPSNGNVPGMNTEDSRCVKTIDNRYKNSSRDVVAGTAIAVLNRQHESSWLRYYRGQVRHHKVSKSIRQIVARIQDKCKHHSPFHASVQTNPVYFGQADHGTTTVLSAHGLTAPAGLHVRTVGTDTAIRDATNQLNGHGIASFIYRLIGYGSGSVQSTVTGPDATRADLLVTPDGKTRLLVNSYEAKATASARVRQKVLTRPVVTTTNPYASTGTGKVKVVAKVPGSAASPVRWTARNAGNNHRFYVRPGHTGAKKFNALDATQVTLSYCWVKHVGDPCSSTTHTYSATPEVVAPAWINAADGGTHCCSVNGTTVKEILSVPLSSKRFYRAWVVLNGKVVQTLDLSSTVGTGPQPINIKKGLLQMKFMAYRNSDFTGALFRKNGQPDYQYVFNQTFN